MDISNALILQEFTTWCRLFFQNCSRLSYHFASFTLCCDIIKNGNWFFFSKCTIYLLSKHCTVSQYNNRRLLLLLITHSQIKKISTIKKLFGLFMLDFIVVVIAENGHFQNKSIDRNLNIYWLILICAFDVYTRS